jgi:hypothetical protein
MATRYQLPQVNHYPRLPQKILPDHCVVIDRIVGHLIRRFVDDQPCTLLATTDLLQAFEVLARGRSLPQKQLDAPFLRQGGAGVPASSGRSSDCDALVRSR